jgi:hypothetical protein
LEFSAFVFIGFHCISRFELVSLLIVYIDSFSVELK